MKTVIEMAREAGFEQFDKDANEWICFANEINRFAELVRADAIAEEREACAKVCDKYDGSWYVHRIGAQECAAAIRGRT